MGMSDYLRSLRRRVGNDLILMPGVAAIIRDDAGRLLLQRRGDNGAWSLPGGAVDPGEAPADTVVREVLEETGLVVVPVRIVAVVGGARDMRFTYPNGDQVEVVATVFACRVIGGSLRCDGDETLALEYFEPGALPPVFPHFPLEVLDHAGDSAWFDVRTGSGTP